MRLVNSLTALGLLACLVAAPAVAQAQTVTKQSQATATVTIQAINSTTRTLTLRNEKGEEDTFRVPFVEDVIDLGVLRLSIVRFAL